MNIPQRTSIWQMVRPRRQHLPFWHRDTTGLGSAAQQIQWKLAVVRRQHPTAQTGSGQGTWAQRKRSMGMMGMNSLHLWMCFPLEPPFIDDFHSFSIGDQNRFEDISQWIGSLTLSTNSVSASEFLSLDREWMELIQKWNCEQEFPFFWFSTFFFFNYLKARKRWFIPYPDAAWTYHRAAWLAQTSLIISVNSDPVTLYKII